MRSRYERIFLLFKIQTTLPLISFVSSINGSTSSPTSLPHHHQRRFDSSMNGCSLCFSVCGFVNLWCLWLYEFVCSCVCHPLPLRSKSTNHYQCVWLSSSGHPTKIDIFSSVQNKPKTRLKLIEPTPSSYICRVANENNDVMNNVKVLIYKSICNTKYLFHNVFFKIWYWYIFFNGKYQC